MILWIAAFLRWGGNFFESAAIVIKSSQYQAPDTLTSLPSHNGFNNRDRPNAHSEADADGPQGRYVTDSCGPFLGENAVITSGTDSATTFGATTVGTKLVVTSTGPVTETSSNILTVDGEGTTSVHNPNVTVNGVKRVGRPP
jgi:hypothetical protein